MFRRGVQHNLCAGLVTLFMLLTLESDPNNGYKVQWSIPGYHNFPARLQKRPSLLWDMVGDIDKSAADYSIDAATWMCALLIHVLPRGPVADSFGMEKEADFSDVLEKTLELLGILHLSEISYGIQETPSHLLSASPTRHSTWQVDLMTDVDPKGATVWHPLGGHPLATGSNGS